MSRRREMIANAYLGYHIPKTEDDYLREIFDAKKLIDPDGVAYRKVSVVQHISTESHLIAAAKSRAFVVTRVGAQYMICRPHIVPMRLC